MNNETQTLVWLAPAEAVKRIPLGSTILVRYRNKPRTYQYEICGHFRPDWLAKGEYYLRMGGHRKFAILKKAP